MNSIKQKSVIFKVFSVFSIFIILFAGGHVWSASAQDSLTETPSITSTENQQPSKQETPEPDPDTNKPDISSTEDSYSPTFNFIVPNNDIVVTQGKKLVISWMDDNFESDSTLYLGLDIDESHENGLGEFWIVENLSVEQDGYEDYFELDTTLLVPGDYYLYVKIIRQNTSPLYFECKWKISIIASSDDDIDSKNSDDSADKSSNNDSSLLIVETPSPEETNPELVVTNTPDLNQITNSNNKLDLSNIDFTELLLNDYLENSFSSNLLKSLMIDHYHHLDKWVLINFYFSDGEGRIGLGVVNNEEIEVISPANPKFNDWLLQLPSELLEEDLKQYFLVSNSEISSFGYVDNTHRLPWKGGESHLVTRGNDIGLHKNLMKYAYDFSMSGGTDVYSSFNGKVVKIVESNGPGYCDSSAKPNYVVINNSDGTSSLYLHLIQNGAVVNVGQSVQQGDIVGKSGNSGYVCETSGGFHLHFQVQSALTSAQITGATYMTQSRFVRFDPNGYILEGQNPISGNYGPALLISPINGLTLNYLKPNFDWTDVSTGSTIYRLQVSLYSNLSSPIIDTNLSLTTSSYSYSKELIRNKTYYWRVYDNKSKRWSKIQSFKTPNSPYKPTLVSPGSNALVTDYTPTLDWSTASLPSGTNFAYYRLQVASDPSWSNLIVNTTNLTSLSQSQFTISSSLQPNSKYYWRVMVYNTLGQYSSWGGSTFRTALEKPILYRPTNGDTTSYLRRPLDWYNVLGATGYTIQVSPYSNMSSPIINSNVAVSAYFPSIDLPKNKKLYWRIRATGTNGPSLWSDTWNFITPNPPSIPSLVSPSNGATGVSITPTLDWSNSSVPLFTTFAYYEVQVAPEKTFSSPIIDWTISGRTNSSMKINSGFLLRLKVYFWRVRAFNSEGHYSTWSGVRSFKTY